MIGHDAMRQVLLDQGAWPITNRIIVHNSYRFPEYDKGPYLFIDPCSDDGRGVQLPLNREDMVFLRDWLDMQLKKMEEEQ